MLRKYVVMLPLRFVFLGVFATYVLTRVIYAHVFRQFTRVGAYHVIIKTM